MSLVEFLFARLDEERFLAEKVRGRTKHVPPGIGGIGDTGLVGVPFWRALADIESKRRLIDWSAPVSGFERVPTDRPGVYNKRPVRYVNEDGEDVLRYLAMPYADHPDFRDEWRP